MAAITVTLNDIRNNKPCAPGWRNLLSSQGKLPANIPVPAETLLQAVGFDNVIWGIGLIADRYPLMFRLYAVWCAHQVQDQMTDPRSLDALVVATKHANGQATDIELAFAKAAAHEATETTPNKAAAEAAASTAIAILGDAITATVTNVGIAAAFATPNISPSEITAAMKTTLSAKLLQLFQAGEWVD